MTKSSNPWAAAAGGVQCGATMANGERCPAVINARLKKCDHCGAKKKPTTSSRPKSGGTK